MRDQVLLEVGRPHPLYIVVVDAVGEDEARRTATGWSESRRTKNTIPSPAVRET
jgi:hypothetical protein